MDVCCLDCEVGSCQWAFCQHVVFVVVVEHCTHDLLIEHVRACMQCRVWSICWDVGCTCLGRGVVGTIRNARNVGFVVGIRPEERWV